MHNTYFPTEPHDNASNPGFISDIRDRIRRTQTNDISEMGPKQLRINGGSVYCWLEVYL